jgi:hypothetical protein
MGAGHFGAPQPAELLAFSIAIFAAVTLAL